MRGPDPDFLHAALDEFSKERRMKFTEATKFHRKSGEGLGNPDD
jgi:hypothetical protein